MKTNKPEARMYRYYNDTYLSTIYIGIGAWDELKPVCKKKGPEISDKLWNEMGEELLDGATGTTFDLVTEGEKNIYFIYMPAFDSSVESLVTLSHECGHAAHFALVKRGWAHLDNIDSFHSLLYFKDAIYSNLLEQIISYNPSGKNKKPSKKTSKVKKVEATDFSEIKPE